MDVQLIEEDRGLPTLTKEEFIESAVAESQNGFNKKYDFFIIYQSTGVNGEQLPDHAFANDLKETLKGTKTIRGNKTKVFVANESAEGMGEVLTKMSKSVVVLVIFSEAALRTFAEDAHKFQQSNFLLMLQFALKLHDNKGVRMLSLNLVAQEVNEDQLCFVKFQGWNVRFKDVPHHSEWIQASISKSMNHIFAIQGMNIDPVDWKFKVPELYSSLYSFEDEVNSYGLLSTLFVVPWNQVWQLWLTFILCLSIPVCAGGIIFGCLKPKTRAKNPFSHVILLAQGISITGIGIFIAILAILMTYRSSLCSNEVRCELLVRSGNLWARWEHLGSNCGCGTDWKQEFSSDCAKCVCSDLRNESLSFDSCNDSGAGWFLIFLAVIVIVGGVINIFFAFFRASKAGGYLEEEKVEGDAVPDGAGVEMENGDRKGKKRTASFH